MYARRESSPRGVCRGSLRLSVMESVDDKACLLQCSLICQVFPLGRTPVVSRFTRLPFALRTLADGVCGCRVYTEVTCERQF